MKRLFLFVLVLWSAQLHAQSAQSYEEGLREATAKIAASIAGQERQIATVLDLNNLDGATTQLGKLVAQDVFDQLVSSGGGVTWIDLSRRDAVVRENKLAADRLMDETTQKQLGKLLGLSLIVSGTVTELGDSARIQLRAMEIETARVLGVASTTVALPESLKRLNDRRVAGSSGSGAGSSPARAETRNEILVLRSRNVSLVRLDPYMFRWSTSVEIENVSGTEVYLQLINVGLGPCVLDRPMPDNTSGIELFWGDRTSVESRRSQSTRLAPGQLTAINVTGACYLTSLPAFSSGKTDVSVSFAAIIGDKDMKLSMSLLDATVVNSVSSATRANSSRPN